MAWKPNCSFACRHCLQQWRSEDRAWPGTFPAKSTMFVLLMLRDLVQSVHKWLAYSRCLANTNDLATPLVFGYKYDICLNPTLLNQLQVVHNYSHASVTIVELQLNRTGTHKHVLLTSACCVHSNVYGLSNIRCIMYHTVVDSIFSTFPPVQTQKHLTSCSVKVPVHSTAKNPSSVRKIPVPKGRLPHYTGIRKSATKRLVSYTGQGINTFTNILQGHKTVVLVCCAIE